MRAEESMTRRINPDSIQTLWLTVALVGFLAVASFMVSFTGLHEVAAWAGLPEWLRWAVPVFIDVAILAYTLAVLIHRHRGESTWASWLSLAGFTLFSMVANASHALAIPHPDTGQQVIGAAVAAIAPVSVFAATEQLGRLVIRHPEPSRTRVLAGAAVPQGSGPRGGVAVSALPVVVEDAMAVPSVEPVQVRPARPAVQLGVPVQVPEPVPVAERPAQANAARPVKEKSPMPPSAPVQGPDAAKVAKVPAGTVERPAAVPAPPVAPIPARPSLSVVGRSVKPASLADWVAAQVTAGNAPKGKGAAEFLGVSERTGRRNLTELKAEHPELFEPIVPLPMEGTNR